MRVDEFSPTPILRQARGAEQIADALRAVQFPITKSELVVRLEGRAVDYGDTATPLAEIVRGVAQARFGDRAQAERAVGARWMRIAKALEAVEEVEEKERARAGRART